ncbi:hypothetical protein OHS58_17610 [Amycolatopsis sp. NBC_00348]|uniref:hypothetical protein n=1 Tax=Amycolatopsis sp. NBC_00348 TaxID=2975956 RepID=UPI002E2571A6
MTPRVRAAVEATGHHGGCAEIGALCRLEEQQVPIEGAEGLAVHVAGGSQGYGPEVHGMVKPFCPACEKLFDYLGGGTMK